MIIAQIVISILQCMQDRIFFFKYDGMVRLA